MHNAIFFFDFASMIKAVLHKPSLSFSPPYSFLVPFTPCILGQVNQNQWSCCISFPISIRKLTAMRRPVGASAFMNYSTPFCLTLQSTVITPYRTAHQSWVEFVWHLGLKQTGLYHCCRYHNVIHCGEWRSGRQSQFTVHGCL